MLVPFSAMATRKKDTRQFAVRPFVCRVGRAMLVGGFLLLAGCYTVPPRGEISWIKYAPPPPIAAEMPRPRRNLEVFDWVWSTVNAYYYDSSFRGIDWPAARARHRAAAEAAVDEDQLYRTINALLGELADGHTFARSPRTVAELRDRRWVWIGLEFAALASSPEKLVVTYVWPGGSASEAGVRRGWILETCNDLGARTYIQDRRFEVGQKLACAFRDEHDQPHQLELVARPVEHPSVRAVRVLAGDCVYLRFDEFKYATTQWLYEQLQAHQGTRAVILDERYNTGGDVAYLEYVAGLFLPRGQELGVFTKRGQPSETVNSRRPLFAPRFRGDVAIIVSTSSASAAEIFADAMQHFRRAVIVGQATAGRVLNAYQVALPDGGELSFSVRDFFTSDGRRLEGIGVAPDAVIEYQLAGVRAGQDPGVEAALRALRPSVFGTSR